MQQQTIHATIDGRRNIQWVDHQILLDTDTLAQGYVKFHEGFTVDPSYTLTLDIVDPISGVINLGRQNTTVGATGAIALVEPIVLNANASMPQGGIVYGDGQTISFEGDFQLPTRKRLKIMSDTVLDGRGNNFSFGQDAQIIIDHGVTVTLKNMTITNLSNGYFKQMLTPLGPTSQVALQNVVFDLQDDMYFKLGKLYVHGDVLVSGEHTFMYRSSETSYIMPGASFVFDTGSTFNYNPTTTADSLITMLDSSSSIVFDGAHVESFSTPLRLTNGKLYFDNDVTVSSFIAMPSYGVASNLAFSSVLTGGGAIEPEEEQIADQYVNALAWTSDGKHLAVGLNADSGSELRVYSFSAGALTLIDDVSKNFTGKQSVLSVDWRTGDQYLAVGLENDFDDRPELRIYSFDSAANAQTLTQVDVSQNVGYDVNTVRWRSDGKYLAIGADNTGGVESELRVYEFDSSAETLINQAAVSFLSGHHVTSVAWRTTGVITVGCTSGTTYDIKTYDFSGTALTASTLNVEVGQTVNALDWEVTSTYLAVGVVDDSGSGNELCVYRYSMGSPDSLKALSSACTNTGQTVNTVHWSPDSKYLAVGFEHASGGGHEIRVYGFASEALTFLPGAAINFDSQDVNTVRWNNNGTYLSVGLSYGNENGIRVYSFDGTTLSLTDSEVARAQESAGVRYHTGYDLEIQTSPPLLNKYNVGQTVLTDVQSLGTSVNVNAVNWHPDGVHIAVGLSDDAGVGSELCIYEFDGTTGSESLVELSSLGVSTGQTINSVAWSSDGLHLAVGMSDDASTGNEIRVYVFDNTPGAQTLVEVAGTGKDTSTLSVYSVAWSPDGAYLAAGLTFGTGNELRVYSFNGTTLTEIDSVNGVTVNAVSWSPDGAYLAAGKRGTEDRVAIYSFDGNNLTFITKGEDEAWGLSVSWSPDGCYLAVGYGANADGEVRVYRFANRQLTKVATGEETGVGANSVHWSCDGAYLAAGLSGGSGSELRVYKFTGAALEEVTEAGQQLSVQPVKSVNWSPDGGYLVAGLALGGNDEIRVYRFGKTDYAWNPTGFIFDDVTVLAGAQITMYGNIEIDD